ncbi:MAG: CHASE3 domain-containing protein, partial [Xanthomonadaceae bacterium]|nr:CHASE3 domain-containing protein [Xanthomonadaceae bacterium]
MFLIGIERAHRGMPGLAIAGPAKQIRAHRGPAIDTAPGQFIGPEFRARKLCKSLCRRGIGGFNLATDCGRDGSDFITPGGGVQCVHVCSFGCGKGTTRIPPRAEAIPARRRVKAWREGIPAPYCRRLFVSVPHGTPKNAKTWIRSGFDHARSPHAGGPRMIGRDCAPAARSHREPSRRPCMREPQAPLPGMNLNRVSRSTGLPRRVLAMAAVALLLIVALAAAVFQTAQRYRSDEKWTLHSYQVREQVLQLVNHLHLAEMEARSYGLTGREISFRQYGQAIRAVDDSTGQLATLVSDNPQQVAAVGQLRDAIAARREQFEAILNNYRLQGASAAHAEVVALVSQSTRPVDDVANRILAREADLLRTREAASARNGRTVALSAAVALGGSLALLLAAFFTVGLEQHRRRRSERALEQSTVDLQAALQEANRSSETLRRLSTLAELLQNCRDLDEAINVIERALPPLLSDVSGALALVNASRNIVEGRMHWGV